MNTKNSELLKKIMNNLQVVEKELGTSNNTSAQFNPNSQISLNNDLLATSVSTSKTYKKQ